MKKQFNNGYKIIEIALLFTIIMTTIFSCKNEDDSQTIPGGASVKINVIAASSESEVIVRADGNTNNTIKTGSNTQTMIQPLGESNSLLVSLTPTSSISSQKNNTEANGGNKAVAFQQALAPNTKYELLVYNSAGAFVVRQIYSYGQEASAPDIQLNAGQTYTFVVTSINSTATTPSVADVNQLATAKLPNIGTQLMYFKKTMTLVEGNNNMDVILKHQYSEITTILRMDANTTGNITAIGSPVFKTTHTNANLKLSDGVITYNAVNPTGSAITFSSIGTGTRAVSSTGALIINPLTANGILNFGSLTVDGETKTNVSVSNLNIVPGHRYDLDLTIKTCTQNVTGTPGLDWSYPEAKGDCIFANFGCKTGINVGGIFKANGNILSQTFTSPAADYGFVLDITSLDNSFNMKINNTSMATKEIQFQSNAASPQNIQFADGSKYEGTNTQGGANIEAIYNMTGTAANPLIKIVISRFGVITMYGSKVSGGPLFPLVFISGTATSFNTFNWTSGSSTNTVVVTQLIDGRTVLKGTGSGKKKISCN